MNLKNPADDLATYVGGQTLGSVGLVKGRNVFAAPPSALASAAVFFTNTGGEVEPYMSSTPAAFVRSGVTATVYGVQGTPGYTQAEGLARALLGYLQQSRPTGYVSIQTKQGAPDFVGVGTDGRGQWTINFEAWYTV